MMHSVPSTFSPSSLRITRSTPCVDGCCGPILSTSSVESRNVDSGIQMLLAALDVQVLLYPPYILSQNRIIFAQRVPYPPFRQQNAAHVGLPSELDPQHGEHFALQPARRREQP